MRGPCSAAIRSTSSCSRRMFSYRFDGRRADRRRGRWRSGRGWRCRWRDCRRPGRRRVGVRFDQDLVRRQVDHREAVVVRTVRDPMHLDRPVRTLQDVFFGERLKGRRLARFRQTIRAKRAGRRPRRHVVRLVDLMRDDRGTLVHERAKAAGVIEVMMGVHDGPDRLARNRFLDLGDHRQRSRFIERRFDHRGIVAHVDGDAMVRSTGEVVDAFGEFLAPRHEPEEPLRPGPQPAR